MFSVVWTDHALDDLANLWVTVDPQTRNRIEAAVNWLNVALQLDPNEVGESRPNNRRIAFAGPLVISFRVEGASSTVRVNHVSRYGR
jgi:plasmid stabilization system protein ParE